MKTLSRMEGWAVLLGVVCAPPAFAGGLYLYEVGGPEVGLASAGYAARAQDATTVWTNPAGMTRLTASEVQGGLQPMYLSLKFHPDGNTSARNRNLPSGETADDGDASAWMPAGSAFVVQPVGENLRLGFGVAGYFGLALKYGDDWVGRYYVKETKLQGLSLLPTAAYRVNDWLSLGAGFTAMYGMFEDKVAVNNNPLGVGTEPDGELELKDNVWGYGANFGVLLEPGKSTRLGATYLTQTKLKFKTSPELTGIRPAMQEIADRLEATELDLGVTAPQAVMVSVFHDLTERLAVMADVGWQDWSRFGEAEVSVSSANTDQSVTTDLDYKDTWHGALGLQYRPTDPWVLSCGAAYDTSMLDDDQRGPNLAVGATWRFGLGAQYAWSKALALSGAYELAWGGDLSMDVNRGPLAGRVSGEYQSTAMHVLNVSADWKF